LDGGLRRVIRLRISARTAATLLGIPVAVDPDRPTEPDAPEAARPDWRAELDLLEAAGKPTLSPYAELDEVLEARIAGLETAEGASIHSVGARCGSRHRGPQGDLRRRGRCPKTRR
jgi:hypothetical protein